MSELISVVAPVTNEPVKLVGKVWDSVLTQTHKDVELVIVDDGAEDEKLLKLIKKYEKMDRVVVGRREKRSERDARFRTVSEAMNLGVSLSSGDWIAHNASDNWFEPEWAETLLKFAEGRDLNGICCNWKKHYYDGRVEEIDMHSAWDWSRSSLENYIETESLGGWIYKREWCEPVKFDERFPRKQTREWHLRLLETGDIVYCPKFLWHFVQHEEDQQKNYASIHWRILADLKNNISTVQNLITGIRISQNDPWLYLVAVGAFHRFMTEEMWREDYERSLFRCELQRVMQHAWEEAIER